MALHHLYKSAKLLFSTNNLPIQIDSTHKTLISVNYNLLE